jgi:hypothetical protein
MASSALDSVIDNVSLLGEQGVSLNIIDNVQFQLGALSDTLKTIQELERRLKTIQLNARINGEITTPPNQVILTGNQLNHPRIQRDLVYGRPAGGINPVPGEVGLERGFLLDNPGGGAMYVMDRGTGGGNLSQANRSQEVRLGIARGNRAVTVGVRPQNYPAPSPTGADAPVFAHVHVHADDPDPNAPSSWPSLDDMFMALRNNQWDDPDNYIVGTKNRFFLIRSFRRNGPWKTPISQDEIDLLWRKAHTYAGFWMDDPEYAMNMILRHLRDSGFGVYIQDNQEQFGTGAVGPAQFAEWDGAGTGRVY